MALMTPGPAAAKHKANEPQEQQKQHSEDSGANPALVELGCVWGSHCHTSVTCQILCPALTIHPHSGLQGRELAHTEPMRTGWCGQSSKAWEMNLR